MKRERHENTRFFLTDSQGKVIGEVEHFSIRALLPKASVIRWGDRTFQRCEKPAPEGIIFYREVKRVAYVKDRHLRMEGSV